MNLHDSIERCEIGGVLDEYQVPSHLRKADYFKYQVISPPDRPINKRTIMHATQTVQDRMFEKNMWRTDSGALVPRWVRVS